MSLKAAEFKNSGISVSSSSARRIWPVAYARGAADTVKLNQSLVKKDILFGIQDGYDQGKADGIAEERARLQKLRDHLNRQLAQQKFAQQQQNVNVQVQQQPNTGGLSLSQSQGSSGGNESDFFSPVGGFAGF